MDIKTQLNMVSIASIVTSIAFAFCNHVQLELHKQKDKTIESLRERIYKLEQEKTPIKINAIIH